MKAMIKMIAVAAQAFATSHAVAQHVPEAEKYRISTQGGAAAVAATTAHGVLGKNLGGDRAFARGWGAGYCAGCEQQGRS